MKPEICADDAVNPRGEARRGEARRGDSSWSRMTTIYDFFLQA